MSEQQHTPIKHTHCLCPNCQKPREVAAPCTHCGAPIRDEFTTPPKNVKSAQPCPTCGKWHSPQCLPANNPHYHECPGCGAQIQTHRLVCDACRGVSFIGNVRPVEVPDLDRLRAERDSARAELASIRDTLSKYGVGALPESVKKLEAKLMKEREKTLAAIEDAGVLRMELERTKSAHCRMLGEFDALKEAHKRLQEASLYKELMKAKRQRDEARTALDANAEGWGKTTARLNWAEGVIQRLKSESLVQIHQDGTVTPLVPHAGKTLFDEFLLAALGGCVMGGSPDEQAAEAHAIATALMKVREAVTK